MSEFNGMYIGDLPKKCPKIGLTPMPGAEHHIAQKKITIQGDPFHIGAYRSGDEFIACDYDLPDGNLSLVVRGSTNGPLIYENRSCYELNAVEYTPTGESITMTRRIIYLSSRFAHTVLVHVRRNDGTGIVEAINYELPLTIEPHFKWQVTEADLSTGNPSADMKMIHEQTGNFYQVFIGKKKWECLQWLRTFTSQAGHEQAEESYISIQSGLPVLIRHFIGHGWPNLDEYRKSPKMEHNGRIYYLWYIRRIIRGEPAAES